MIVARHAWAVAKVHFAPLRWAPEDVQRLGPPRGRVRKLSDRLSG